MLSSSRAASSLVRPIRSFSTTGSRHYAVTDLFSASPNTSVPPVLSEGDTSTRNRSLLPEDGTPSASSPASKPRRRTILARPNTTVRNMSEALILLRAVEKEFGPVREFQFPRDIYSHTAYASYFAVDFEDPTVRAAGRTLKVTVPSLDTSTDSVMDGGPSLVSLYDRLQPSIKAVSTEAAVGSSEQVDPEAKANVEAKAETGGVKKDDKASPRVMEIRLEQAETQFSYNVKKFHPMSKQTRDAVGSGFVRWGGFAPNATSSEFGAVSISYPPRMQAVMNKLRRNLGQQRFAAAESPRIPVPATSKSEEQPTASTPSKASDELPDLDDWSIPGGDASIEIQRMLREAFSGEKRKTISDAGMNSSHPTGDSATSSSASASTPEPLPSSSIPPKPVTIVSAAERARRVAADQAARKRSSTRKVKTVGTYKSKEAAGEAEEPKPGMVSRVRDFLGL